jgi:hypothetical protein
MCVNIKVELNALGQCVCVCVFCLSNRDINCQLMLEASEQTINDFFAFFLKKKIKVVDERIKTQTFK